MNIFNNCSFSEGLLAILVIIIMLMPIILLIGFIIGIIILVKKLINAKKNRAFIYNQDDVLQEEKNEANKKVKNYRKMLILLILICICTEISCIWYRFGVDIKSYVNEKKYQYIANKSEITNYTELPYSFNISNYMGYTDHSTINIIKEFEYNGKKYILYPDLDNVKYISTCKTKKYVAKINNYYLDPIIDANQDSSYIQFTNNFGKYDYSINNLEKHYYDIYNINYAPEGALYLELYDKIYIEEQFYYDYEWSKKEVQKISRNVYLLDWSPYCEDEAKKYNIELH